MWANRSQGTSENLFFYLPSRVYIYIPFTRSTTYVSIAWDDHGSEKNPTHHWVHLGIHRFCLFAMNNNQGRGQVTARFALLSVSRLIKGQEHRKEQSGIYHRSILRSEGTGRAEKFIWCTHLPYSDLIPTSVSLSWKIYPGGGVIYIIDVKARTSLQVRIL